uniref:C2H2-type domain-containing protein n=1 Tax=Strigamia maritima TaxID=126957 RepID=T1IZN8_STRMM
MNNLVANWPQDRRKRAEILTDKLKKVKQHASQHGISETTFKSLCHHHPPLTDNSSTKPHGRTKLLVPSVALLVAAVIIGLGYTSMDKFRTNKCALENNFFVMEVTRPVTNCSICTDVKQVRILTNLTRELFAQHAYTSRPFLVKGETGNWTALTSFSFDFFKHLYHQIPSGFDSVEEECQFFPFKTNFLSLTDVFEMDKNRAELKGEPWYVGWSNCNPEVAAVLRQHYQRPHFLPEDSESSAIDWIFMGGSGQGASMHLDYVHRPSWQAQIKGKKTWHLVPPPECEHLCHELKVDVNPGDIFFLDTNQWYHDTLIQPDKNSFFKCTKCKHWTYRKGNLKQHVKKMHQQNNIEVKPTPNKNFVRNIYFDALEKEIIVRNN